MKVAIYCRLSEEDKNKLSKNDDSESIQNQKNMLLEYSMSHEWEVYDIYSDDDFKGSDRKRPAFNRLLKDAENKKFDIVLCKSQSRFSRELEIVEKYINGKFLEWNIRFIGYADNAEKLLSGLDTIDWPESTKEMQRNWIGKSTGVEVDFKITGGGKFSIFTTCVETIYGITFMVLAPENELVDELKPRIKNWDEVIKYREITAKKSDLDRTELNKGKTGVRLDGVMAIHPITGKEVPIFLGDFVLASYGTGAVMAVPTHDERDFEYAKFHHLEMIQVIDGRDVTESAFEKQDYLGKGCKLIKFRK